MDLPLPISLTTPPFTVRAPVAQTVPLVFASPHSGRVFPPGFLESARLDEAGLRRSEDSFVDELFSGAPQIGAPLLAATFPRAFCDPNREKWELDPAMFAEALPNWVNTTSARVGAGLGTIARVVASGEAIYRRKLSFTEAEHRVEHYWLPYHGALEELLAGTRARFGACLLIDCHSMPAQSCGTARAPGPDVILGDAHGTTCSPRVTRLVEAVLSGLGYIVGRNDPYAGGYVTRTYGRPREGIHAIQIEVARRLYMDEGRLQKRADFARVRADMDTLMRTLSEAVTDVLRS